MNLAGAARLFTTRIQIEFAYRFDVFSRIMVNLTILAASVFVWRAALGGQPAAADVSASQITTYLIVSSLLSAAFRTDVQTKIPGLIREGQIAIELVRPMSGPFKWLVEDLGNSTASLVLAGLPVALVAGVLVHPPMPASLVAAGGFAVSAMLSMAILWPLSALVGMIAFWAIEIGELGYFKDMTVRLFSGAFVPVWFFPDWFQTVSTFLPFASIYQTPLGIFVGKYGASEIPRLLGFQLFWAAILWSGVALMWTRATRKVLVQGG